MSSIDQIRVLRLQLDVTIHERDEWRRKYAMLHTVSQHALRCLEHGQPLPGGFIEQVIKTLREALDNGKEL